MASIMKYVISGPYFDVECQMGEGLYFDSSYNALRWVDNVAGKLHVLVNDERGRSYSHFQLPSATASTVEIEGDDSQFAYGSKYGFAFMKKYATVNGLRKRWGAGIGFDYGIDIVSDNKMTMKSNAGAADAQGRYWVGLTGLLSRRLTNHGRLPIDDNLEAKTSSEKKGVLFRLHSDLSLHRVAEGMDVPNGISWSKDDTIMYLTGSYSNSILAYPFDLVAGKVDIEKGKAIWTAPTGVLYGHCQDAEGCLWVANHGAARVWRVSPEGHTLAEIVLPTRCVTCPAFAKTQLFIATMAELEPDDYPWSIPHQGSLFSIDVGVMGRPLNKCKMGSVIVAR